MPESQEPDSSQTKAPLVIDAATGLPDPTPGGKERPCDLATAVDVRREMCRTYRDMRDKRIDPGDGTKFIYALTAIGKMIEVHEIERRLTELEERQSGKLLGTPGSR